MISSAKSDWAVYVCRHQPFTNHHLDAVQNLLDQHKNLLVIISGSSTKRTLESPFFDREQLDSIRETLNAPDRIRFAFCEDYEACEDWYSTIQSVTFEYWAPSPPRKWEGVPFYFDQDSARSAAYVLELYYKEDVEWSAIFDLVPVDVLRF